MPDSVGAKEFEEIVITRGRKDEALGRYMLDRCGVRSTFHDGEWRPVKSLPDFSGVCPGGLVFTLDTKTCQQPSYDMTGGTGHSLKHQLKFMQRQARFGAVCFLLIFFCKRKLKTKTQPPLTVAFPVADNLFWQSYEAGGQKKITRADALNYGAEVTWNLWGPRAHNTSPDILAAVKAVADIVGRRTT
jgi:penicillin-binding protein-related factor A (putative recombinase)